MLHGFSTDVYFSNKKKKKVVRNSFPTNSNKMPFWGVTDISKKNLQFSDNQDDEVLEVCPCSLYFIILSNQNGRRTLLAPEIVITLCEDGKLDNCNIGRSRLSVAFISKRFFGCFLSF